MRAVAVFLILFTNASVGGSADDIPSKAAMAWARVASNFPTCVVLRNHMDALLSEGESLTKSDVEFVAETTADCIDEMLDTYSVDALEVQAPRRLLHSACHRLHQFKDYPEVCARKYAQ